MHDFLTSVVYGVGTCACFGLGYVALRQFELLSKQNEELKASVKQLRRDLLVFKEVRVDRLRREDTDDVGHWLNKRVDSGVVTYELRDADLDPAELAHRKAVRSQA